MSAIGHTTSRRKSAAVLFSLPSPRIIDQIHISVIHATWLRAYADDRLPPGKCILQSSVIRLEHASEPASRPPIS